MTGVTRRITNFEVSVKEGLSLFLFSRFASDLDVVDVKKKKKKKNLDWMVERTSGFSFLLFIIFFFFCFSPP